MSQNNPIDKTTEDLLINPASGDSYFVFKNAGVNAYAIGVDDTDAQSLKFNRNGADPSSGTNHWKMTTAGIRTLPLQPCFFATLASNDNNVTGAGGSYSLGNTTLGFTALTLIYDRGSNFNTVLGIFTAPVTGIYYFNTHITASGITVANNSAGLVLNSPLYLANKFSNPGATIGSSTQQTFFIEEVVYVSSGTTILVNFAINGGGADTVDILGNAALSLSYFSGYLIE